MQRLVLFNVGNCQLGVDMSATAGVESATSLLGENETSSRKNTVIIDSEEIPVCDLSDMLGDSPASHDPGNRKVMLLRTQGDTLALLVDRVDRVIEVKDQNILPLPPIFKGVAHACFPRVLIQEGQLVLVLSPEGMVRAALRSDIT
jgi:chemotaxis signal transduction protein